MLKLDFRDWNRVAKQWGAAADQVPFALANAMTAGAFKAREVLADETWPGAVDVRNRALMRASLRIEKAKKRNLSVTIYDRLGRAHLALHADGGTKGANGRLAIPPTGTVKRGAKGVPKGQRPSAIIAKTPKRALRITPRGIYVGEGGRLHLRYAFASSANIKADVPFNEDFARVMTREMLKHLPAAIRGAMSTRKGRRR